MTSGRPLIRCTAKSKRTGDRCGHAPSPFQRICATHGSMSPQAHDAAEKRFLAWVDRPEAFEPEWSRREKLRAWEKYNTRYQRRRMAKIGVTLEDLANVGPRGPQKTHVTPNVSGGFSDFEALPYDHPAADHPSNWDWL